MVAGCHHSRGILVIMYSFASCLPLLYAFLCFMPLLYAFLCYSSPLPSLSFMFYFDHDNLATLCLAKVELLDLKPRQDPHN